MNLISPENLSKIIDSDCIVIDTRSHFDFALGHLPASINIFFPENFFELWNLLVNDDSKVVLITDKDMELVLEKNILKTGFQGLVGILEGGFPAWKKTFPNKVDLIIDVSPEEFRIDYQFDEFHLIDVRTEDQFELCHIEDAENFPIADLIHTIADVAIHLPIYIYGASYSEAVLAASIFKYYEINNVRVVNDGFERIITTEKLPTVSSKKQSGASNSFFSN
jgi:rhodanese-related sulfurtransferase